MDKVPLELLRLRSATTAYSSILRDISPALEGLAAVADDRHPGLATRLLRSVQTSLDHDTEPGTVAHIAFVLAALLGEAT